MFLRRSLAQYRYIFWLCRYIWGSCPPPPPRPNTKKLATLVLRPLAPGMSSAPAPRQGPYGGALDPTRMRRAPRGWSPRKLSSFQQIRAFKMVVRSDRNCNFSSCNFAYRALVGGRGCGSHQIFRRPPVCLGLRQTL